MRYLIVAIPQNNAAQWAPTYFERAAVYTTPLHKDSDYSPVYFCTNQEHQLSALDELAKMFPGVLFAPVTVSTVKTTSPGAVVPMLMTDKGLVPA